MIATIQSASLMGVHGHPVTVEVHVADGMPDFTIVGRSDSACRETRDRVRAAVVSSSLAWPMKRITVTLAPGDSPAPFAGADLAIAVGVLAADGQIEEGSITDLGFLGQLGLDGSVRPVVGVLPLAEAVDRSQVVVAAHDAAVAGLAARGSVRPVGSLRELIDALAGTAPWPQPGTALRRAAPAPEPDLADIAVGPLARRALEVAAAGGHHLLLVGPPGAGKAALARRLVGLLPDLSGEEALEVTRIHSASGLAMPDGLITRPPFRAPHHSASMSAIFGGCAGRPGEASAATGGVLFLDDLGEFGTAVLAGMREPLEEGVIRVARPPHTIEYPARFLLVAAMNPCPCGAGSEDARCECAPAALDRYHHRLVGPFVDRFDLVVRVDRPDPYTPVGTDAGASSADIAGSVALARAQARERGVNCNSELTRTDLNNHAALDSPALAEVLRAALAEGRITARGLRRVHAVARTIRDLEGGGAVQASDAREAISLKAPIAAQHSPESVPRPALASHR